MKLKIAMSAIALTLAASHVQAAEVPAGLVDVNANACVQMNSQPQTKALDKFAPADPAKVPGYCQCYSKAYWKSVPQADYDGMLAEHAAGDMKGPHSLAIRAALHARNDAAKSSCSK